MDYNWRCTACDYSNTKNSISCSKCLCPTSCNAFMAEAHLRELQSSNTKNQITCEGCDSLKLSAVYPISFMEYTYRFPKAPFRAKLILFKIFSYNQVCSECRHTKTIEVIVPLLRKLYRSIFKKDIENNWLRNI